MVLGVRGAAAVKIFAAQSHSDHLVIGAFNAAAA
jgi:hypothetical protein